MATTRRCKKCFNRLRPTRQVRQGLRTFVCPSCGANWEWIDNPPTGEAKQQIHKSAKGEGFSFISMMSDPCCDVFGIAAAYNGTEEFYAGVEPKCPDFVRPVSAYSKDKKIIARWHWGRGCWVEV